MKKQRTIRVKRKTLPKRVKHLKFITVLTFLLLILVPVSILLAKIPVIAKTPYDDQHYMAASISAASMAASSACSAAAAEPATPRSSLGNSQSDTAMDQKAQQFQSSTRYLILADLQAQEVGIYSGSQAHWTLVNRYPCSSGMSGKDATPMGTFTVQGKGNWFYNPTLREGAEWWTQFSGDFLFHSLPMDKNHTVTDSTLGEPRSHGCIRLNTADAKWIYDNIPRGTKVTIY